MVTLRAKECIENADVIVYDHLANPEILRWARDDAEIIYAGKEPGESRTQQEINTLLIDKAREGKQVVRLKGGDPFVFGRGAEEAQAIADACGVKLELTRLFKIPAQPFDAEQRVRVAAAEQRVRTLA